MLTNLEPPTEPIQFWSWKKITAWFLGILTVFIAALLLYDEKLEPYDDLKPTRTEVPDIRTNGYLMLKAAWENLPPVDSKLRRQWEEIQGGVVPWDDALVAQLNPSRRDLQNDLSKALAAPDWMVPFQTTYEKYFQAAGQIVALEAEAWRLFKGGDPSGVLALVRDLRTLSNRQIKGSNQGVDLYAGCRFDQMAAVLTTNLIADLQAQKPVLQQLAAIWGEDQLSPEDLRQPVAGDCQYMTTYFRSGQYIAGNFDTPSAEKIAFKALRKSKVFENRLHQILRVFQTKGLSTAPSYAGSVFADLDQLHPANQGRMPYLHPNYISLVSVNGSLRSHKFLYTQATRLHLFDTRAVRIAIAVKRWQLSHGGAVPPDLAVLVPEYLVAVPPDPWDGRPMRWDAPTQIIYSVGEDWNPDLPIFGSSQRGWLQSYNPSPGLRLTRPAPPPPPPAPAPKKSPKASPKPSTPPAKP